MSENNLKVGRQNTFRFEGHVILSEKTFTINSSNDKGTWVHNGLNLGIDCGESGIHYVNTMGGYNPTRDNVVYLQKIDSDGKFLSGPMSTKTIAWEDRLTISDADLEDVSPRDIIKIFIERDENGKTIQKNFIAMYDAIAYLKEHLNDKDPISVKGHIEYRPSNDGTDWYTSYVFDTISSKTEEFLHPKAMVELSVLMNDGCIGKPDMETMTIPVYANTLTYVRSVNSKKYNQTCTVPVKFLFDAEKLGLTTDVGRKKFDKMIKTFFKAKKGFVSEILICCNFSSAAKKVEVSLDDLPKEIREGIEAGILNEEQVMGTLAITGKAPQEYVYAYLITAPKVIKDEQGNENTYPCPITIEDKYKEEELLSFEDLEPIEDNTITAPVDNTLPIDEEDESENFDSIMSMFAGMSEM